jgi:hypothetical protein
MKKQQRSIKQVSPTELVGFIYKDKQGRKTTIETKPIPMPYFDNEEYKESIEKEKNFRNIQEKQLFK